MQNTRSCRWEKEMYEAEHIPLSSLTLCFLVTVAVHAETCIAAGPCIWIHLQLRRQYGACANYSL